MASKEEYLRKYLRRKGTHTREGFPTSCGSLKLGSDDEPDVRIERRRRAPGELRGSSKKTLFQVLRRAADGKKFLFSSEDPEYLGDSDEEEVKVVGDDGQILALSEAEKKKVADLIAKEEGRLCHLLVRSPARAPTGALPEDHNTSEEFQRAFGVDKPLREMTQPSSACAPYAPNRPGKKYDARDLSPPRRGQQTKVLPSRRIDEDLSPPRIMLEDRDLSPPRRTPQNRALSPSQAGVFHDRTVFSPRQGREDPYSPRKKRDEDMSLSGKSQQDSAFRRREAVYHEDTDFSTCRRTGAAQKFEGGADSLRRNEAHIDPVVGTDGGGSIVFRDKEGRVISEEEWLSLEGVKGRKKPRVRGPAPVLEWGSGLRQKEDRQSKKKEEEKLANQPFARYEIDAEYDADLKARDRWADPLARAPNGTKTVKAVETDEGNAAKKEERPTCPHSAPPNRFNIRPGYRWDGVVRGNGHEEERLKALNRRQWEAEVAHMNNTADM